MKKFYDFKVHSYASYRLRAEIFLSLQTHTKIQFLEKNKMKFKNLSPGNYKTLVLYHLKQTS